MSSETKLDREFAKAFVRAYYSTIRTAIIYSVGFVAFAAAFFLFALWPTFLGGYIEAGVMPWELFHTALLGPSPDVSHMWGHATAVWWVVVLIGAVAAVKAAEETDGNTEAD